MARSTSSMAAPSSSSRAASFMYGESVRVV